MAGRESMGKKMNACKTSQGQYWADFNCDFIQVAVSLMMNGGLTFPSAKALERESLIWQLSVCLLHFIVSFSLYLWGHAVLHPPPPPSPSYPPPPSTLVFPLSNSHYISLHLYSAALQQIKLRVQFSPSHSTYLCFMTDAKSVLCGYWFCPLVSF